MALWNNMTNKNLLKKEKSVLNGPALKNDEEKVQNRQ
jgi:hypothetical protein